MRALVKSKSISAEAAPLNRRGAPVLMPAWQLLPPETAHALAIWALRRGLAPTVTPPASPRLEVRVLRLRATAPAGPRRRLRQERWRCPACSACGFSFVEVGAVTPRPQAGRPTAAVPSAPQQALINRMGFNNDGLDAVRAARARKRARACLAATSAPIATPGPVADYVACLRGLYELVDYLTVNVSSPNTPGLRDLQGRARLDELLGALVEARSARRWQPTKAAAAQDRSGSGAGCRGRDCRGGARAHRRPDHQQHHDCAAAGRGRPPSRTRRVD